MKRFAALLGTVLIAVPAMAANLTAGNITVSSGSASANFTLTTLPVTAQQNVTIRAAVSVGFKTATLRIAP